MLIRLPILWQLALLVQHCPIARGEDIKLDQQTHDVRQNIDFIRQLYQSHQPNALRESDLPSSSLSLAQAPIALDVTSNVTSIPNPPQVHENLLAKRTVCKGATWRPSFDGQDPCEGFENEPDYLPCFNCGQFTRDWFIQNKIFEPDDDTCLFYTSKQTENAKTYATNWRQTQVTNIWTIWDLWDPIYYNKASDTTNRLRCINQADRAPGVTNRVRQRYFEVMSDAMAFLCGGVVVVMDPNVAPNQSGYVRRAGIWGRIEQPRLRRNGVENGVEEKYRDVAGNLRECSQIDAIPAASALPQVTRYWWRWWYRTANATNPGEVNPAPTWPSPVPVRRRSLGDVDEGELEQGSRSKLEARRLASRDFDVSVYDDLNSGFYIDW